MQLQQAPCVWASLEPCLASLTGPQLTSCYNNSEGLSQHNYVIQHANYCLSCSPERPAAAAEALSCSAADSAALHFAVDCRKT